MVVLSIVNYRLPRTHQASASEHKTADSRRDVGGGEV